MKLAFIATQWQSPWAGSEELWWRAARHALACGHEVAVVCYGWPEMPRQIRELQENGAWILQLARGASPPRFPLLRRLPRIRLERFRIWGALAAWQPDSICISQGGTYDVFFNGVFINFLQKYRFPYIVICQWNSENLFLDYPSARRIADEFFLPARRVAFVSERNLRVTERHIAGDLPNATVVLNPVNLTDFSPVPFPRSGVVRMANVARHDARCKGQDILLQALADERWRQRRWVLRLYGDGPDRPYLERLAGYYRVADRVEFHGHVRDIRSIWADNQLLVMPSRSEGTPLALVEAMLCGRPAVVTDVGGNAEWIEEPATGFIAEARTATSVDKALERAWEARDDWERMGQRAHEVAVSRADPHPEEAILSMLTDIGSEVADGQARAGVLAV